MARIPFRLRALMIVVAFVAMGLTLLMLRFYLARAAVGTESDRAVAESLPVRAAMSQARADPRQANGEAQLELAKAAGKKAMDKPKLVPWEEENTPGGLERERRSDRRSRESATPGSVRPPGKR